jgi:hypothetical protein
MRLSGVDPGIIRELSGIYKPFVKAFKELVSNAYDADAKTITVTVHDDFSTIEVLDDGLGMTPYAFHESFARLGGSTAWLHGGKSPGGRLRIGYKGIGFLAVARYCGVLHVETRSLKPYRGRQLVQRRNRATIPLEDIAGSLVPKALIDGKVSIRHAAAVTGDVAKPLNLTSDIAMTAAGLRLQSGRARQARLLELDFEIDCSGITLEAQLDFDYLLSLEKQADLRLLDDFCTVSFRASDPIAPSYTRVQLHGLKDFVVRDLSAPRAKGKARNIVFKSGKEQFFWRLARTSPIRDDVSTAAPLGPIVKLRKVQEESDLPSLIVKWRSEAPVALARPIYVPEDLGADHSVVPVDIKEEGLHVIGYLLPRREIVYPAELRGISVRVRNVAIGDASFLGWEHILSGPRKAALSQITGELLVLKGLDASDAINPGRESFYEENTHYRILRRTLFGSEETIGGLVGAAVRDILDRIHVRSQVNAKLTEARMRRRTLTDLSSAVNFYSRDRGRGAEALKAFFSESVRANGLAQAREVPLRPGHKIAGFEVGTRSGLANGDVEIDFGGRRVWFDFNHDSWNTTVYLNGHYYDVSLRQGKPDQPICEFDNTMRRIYVNWGHPVKQHMDDATFLKSAILLRLAHYAAPKDANTMMTLALNMIAFRAE